METDNRTTKPEFKIVPCECCSYPISVPAEASAVVCVACPQCGHRGCT